MSDEPARLILLGKPDCHLCHEMKQLVERVLGAGASELTERDIDSDPELKRRYALTIPVLLLGERELARHRVSEAALRARLETAGYF